MTDKENDMTMADRIIDRETQAMIGGPTAEIRAVIENPQAIGWGGNPLTTVEQYLPRGWTVYWQDGMLFIAGRDEAGWTLTDYVLPRLASGCIFAKEIV